MPFRLYAQRAFVCYAGIALSTSRLRAQCLATTHVGRVQLLVNIFYLFIHFDVLIK